MPLAGTGPILGAALVAARRSASGAPQPPPAIAALQLAMATAEANAIIAHLIANGLVVGTATGVTVGAAAVPVTAAIT